MQRLHSGMHGARLCVVALATLLPAGTPAAALPPGTGQQVHCRIDGEEFDADSTLVADVAIPPHGDKWKFRLIAGHGQGLAPNGDRTDIEAKGDQLLAPGTYAMSLQGTWRSTALVKGRHYYVDNGTISLKTYEPRGSRRAAGTLSFVAGGHRGQCSFDVELHVMDFPALLGLR